MKKIIIFGILLIILYTNVATGFLYENDSYSPLDAGSGNNSFLGEYQNGSFLTQPAITSKSKQMKLEALLITSFMDNPGYYFNISGKYNKIGIGGGAALFSAQEFDFIDIYGNSLRKLNFSESMFYINGSKLLLNNFIGIGINIKLHQSNADAQNTSALIFDIGTIYNNLFIFQKEITVGFAIRNLNSQLLKFQFNSFIKFLKLHHTIINFLVGYIYTINLNYSINLGINTIFLKNYYFNIGYSIDSKIANKSGVGIGIIYNKIRFYYTIKPASISTIHLISINYFFNMDKSEN